MQAMLVGGSILAKVGQGVVFPIEVNNLEAGVNS